MPERSTQEQAIIAADIENTFQDEVGIPGGIPIVEADQAPPQVGDDAAIAEAALQLDILKKKRIMTIAKATMQLPDHVVEQPENIGMDEPRAGSSGDPAQQ